MTDAQETKKSRPRWLIPMAIGLGMLGLGAAGAGAYLFLMKSKGEERVALTQQAVAQLRAELDGYFARQGSYPDKLNELGETAERLLSMSLTGSSDVRAIRFKDVLPSVEELRSRCAREPEASYGWLYDARGLVVACPMGETNTAQWAWPVPLSFPNLAEEAEGEGGATPEASADAGPTAGALTEEPTTAPRPGAKEWKPDLVVISAVAPLRSTPARRGRIVARLAQGDELVKMSQRGAWFRVARQDGQTGWVSGYDIKFVEPAAPR